MLPYSTRRWKLTLGRHTVLLDSVADQDALFDALLAKGEKHEDVLDERIPYWADLWPSALALAEYLEQEMGDLNGKQVLEVGCGLGLPGIMAGLLGAEVTFTDYLPEALTFARHNWELNLGRPARFEQLDWRQPSLLLAADLVLASDVAYEERTFLPLPAALRTLCRPGGAILLSEPNRLIAQPFFQSLPDLGFQVAQTWYEGSLNQIPYKVQVLSLTP